MLDIDTGHNRYDLNMNIYVIHFISYIFFKKSEYLSGLWRCYAGEGHKVKNIFMEKTLFHEARHDQKWIDEALDEASSADTEHLGDILMQVVEFKIIDT